MNKSARHFPRLFSALLLLLALALNLTTARAQCTPPPSGLAAWWQGEGNATDFTGTNSGTLSPSGASYATGLVGQGFRFDGTNGFVQIPDSNSLKPANVTVEAWVWLDPALPSNSGEQIVFKKNTWNAFFEGYSLLKTTIDNGNGTYSNRFEFCVSRNGNQVVINSQTIVQRGVWYHVAGTYDGSTSRLFVNGAAEGSAVAGFALDYGSDPIYIGTSGTFAPYLSMFGGIIDEPTIYNRALSTNEIAAIYNAGSAGKCVSLTPPVVTGQPAGQTVTNGGAANFSVSATGTAPLQFQWRLNGTNIFGATNVTLTVNNVSPALGGNYSVLVTNVAGSATSSNALLVVNVPASCLPPPSGLVAWLPAEGGATDYTGTNNGTLQNGVSFAPGEVGQGFYFNNTNQGVRVPARASLDVGAGAGFTLEAWIKPASITTGSAMFEWNDSNYWGVHFSLEPGQPFGPNPGPGELYANIVDSGGGWHQMSSPGGVVATNVFQHVALTYDRASGVATIYCNGLIVAQQNLGSYAPLTGPGYDFYLGRRIAPAGEQPSFAGIMDEPAVYNRALTTNEIIAIYNAGSAGKCSSLSAPLVVTQPTNITVTVNNTAVFNVTATGTQPLSYQWNFNGTNISGATNATFTLNNVTPAQGGNYSVLVTNFLGIATSSNAVLTVYVPPVPPSILSQTPSQVVLLSNAATFIVTASGSDPKNYFWKRNNVLIPGATNFSYTLFNAQLADSGSKFSCLVTNAYGFASSTNASLKVIDTIPNDLCSGAVVITNYNYTNAQSTTRASSFGDPVPGCVDGFGNGVWYQFTSPVSGLLAVDTFGSDFDTGLAIYTGGCGAFSPVDCNDDSIDLTSALTIPTTAGVTYYFLVGGYGGHVGNLIFHLHYFTPPAFDVSPTNLSVIVSSNAQFTAAVSGTSPISLQWYFNNSPLADGGRISGVTNLIFNLANVNTNDGGNYFLVASNFVGVTTSSVAVLTPVILPPVIIVPPVAQSVLVGSNVNFFAVVDGTPPYGFQWSLNGTPLVDGARISGSATASLTISNLVTSDAGTYSLIVVNASGSTNAAATLTVLVPPSITLNPIGRSVPPGLPTTFNAAATGNPLPVYQWQLNGTNIPGATLANYTNAAVGSNDLGFYQLIASNVVGIATSSAAQLTFGPVAAWGRNVSGECLPPPGLSNVVNIAGNSGASFALKSDGTIVAWGSGLATNVPASATNVAAIFGSGSTAAAALRADGTVVGWNMTGMPVLTNIVSLAISNAYGTAVRADGTMIGWSPVNYFGNPYINFPTNLSHIKAVSVGYYHGLALKDDGTVIAWGASGTVRAPETNVPPGLSGVKAIAAGNTSSFALQSNGVLVVWGSSFATNIPAGATNLVSISVNVPINGSTFCQAVRADGRMFTWGSFINNGETNPPAALGSLAVTAVSAGVFHGLALVNDGTPQILQPPVGLTTYLGRDVTLRGGVVGAAPLNYQWLFNGTNIDGATNTTLSLLNLQFTNAGGYQLFVSNALGTAISIPATVNVISNSALAFVTSNLVSATNVYQGGTVKFTAGTVSGNGPLRYQWFTARTNNLPYAAVAGATNEILLLDPALAAQTGNYYLSVSNLVRGITSAPVYVRVLFAKAWGFGAVSNPPVNVTNAIAIATGGSSGNLNSDYFVLGADGKLTAWANYQSSYNETNVSALSNSLVTAIAAASQQSLALKSDGTVYAWGYGGNGQTNPPVNLNGVTAISVGGAHDLALKSDGTVVGWGATPQSNFGQATNNPAATNVVAIAAGNLHSLALRADGSLVSWGLNDGTTTIPFSATNVIAIAAGSGFSAALRGNGTVVQWGNGIANYPAPSNLSNVVAIAASGTHVTALKNDGTVVTWGYEYTGLASNNLPSDLANVIAITSGGDHDFALFGTRAPAFTVNPWNRAVPLSAGTPVAVRLAGKTSGVQPVAYQWRLNGTNIPSATNDFFAMNYNGVVNTQIVAGTYQLVASNSYGIAISKPAKVTIVIPLGDALDTVNTQGVALVNWLTSGNALWFGQTNVTHDGVDAARSGGIGAVQESILQTTFITNLNGSVTFWWKVSSEQFFDALEFRINGTVQGSLSGEVDWTFASFPVSAGTNLLQWRYAKDGSFDSGLDAAFVDQFAFLSGPVIIVQPASLVANAGQNISLHVAASGTPQLGYQWKQNGNSIGSNSSTLTLSSVARAQAGTYSVIVTNSGGAAVSSNALVIVKVPQVLGTPVLLPDGSLQFTSTDANGGALDETNLPNFEAQATTDLVNWTTLPNALSITNGTLQLNDATRTNFNSRYYRIIEH